MDIQFNITSINGTKSPTEWYSQKLKEFAKDKYGLEVNVDFEEQDLKDDKKDLSSTQ